MEGQASPAGDLAAGDIADIPKATWTFAPTPSISCYITALIAGPYDMVRDQVETRNGVVPLGKTSY